MRRIEVHVVIGAGAAGCLSAIMRSRAGYDVVLLERARARSVDTYPVCTGSSNIVSENHSGAEYPFDAGTARDCIDARIDNERVFPELIYGGKEASRVIAAQSMLDAGVDIVGQCRATMEVIRDRYAQRCRDDPAAEVFGRPDTVVSELAGVSGVNDVAAAFVTPQRGINPVLAAAVLDWELRTCGVDVRAGCAVTRVTRQTDGRYRVDYTTGDGGPDAVVADQVSFCCVTEAFTLAREVRPALPVPPLFVGLRTIVCVDLPDGTDLTFTCLKLEGRHGGMFSPMNPDSALVYHPPSAHIAKTRIDPASGALPADFRRYLTGGHPELESRAERTVEALRDVFPQLRRSRVTGAYLKVAVNAAADSRRRRNIDPIEVAPGCTITLLAKWTMCATNALRELRVALAHSVGRGTVTAGGARELFAEAYAPLFEDKPQWAADPALRLERARKHALNMGVPADFARQF